MKRLLFISVFTLSVIDVSCQKLIEGSLDFLCFYTSDINVRWDFSNTKYEGCTDLKGFLEPKYTVQEWDRQLVPAATSIFLQNVNYHTNELGISFVYDRDYADYDMIIAPQTLNKKAKNTTNYTIKDRITGEVKAVIACNTDGGKIGFGSFGKLLKDAYDDAGNDVGSFIYRQTKLPYDKLINYIDERYNNHKEYIKKEGEEMVYTKIIHSPYIQSKDSLYDYCIELLTKAYNNFRHISQLDNKEKGVFIGKGSFFMSNENECPYTITLEVKDGRIRVSYRLSKIKHPSGNEMILSTYPFTPQESIKDNCKSYKRNLCFILNGIISLNNYLNNQMNKIINDDDW